MMPSRAPALIDEIEKLFPRWKVTDELKSLWSERLSRFSGLSEEEIMAVAREQRATRKASDPDMVALESRLYEIIRERQGHPPAKGEPTRAERIAYWERRAAEYQGSEMNGHALWFTPCYVDLSHGHPGNEDGWDVESWKETERIFGPRKMATYFGRETPEEKAAKKAAMKGAAKATA